ncbi:AAA family ATPase [Yoonia sp. MH D7]
MSGTSYSRLEFRLRRSSAWSRPANIGYGLSYAFPLVVALLSAHKGQVVVIDSPEVHLHPRAQSRMGEMLARFANAGIQVLVETHSDHALSGARLAVQKNSLRAEDL